MLTVIIKAANMSISQHRVLCGAAVLGFFFCLRGSEYLSSRGKLHVYCLQVRDIHVHDSNGVVTNKFRTATSWSSTDLPSIRSASTITQCSESQAAIKLTDLHSEPTPSLIHRVHDKNPETSSRAMQYTSAHDINPLTQNGRCNCASFSRRRYGHDSHARTLGIRRIPSVHTRNTSSNITPRQTHESCHITCKSTSPNRSTKWGNTSVNSRVIESITSKCKKNDLFFPNTDDDEVKGNGHLLAAAKEGFSGAQESQYQTEQSARHTSFYPAKASMPSRTPSRSSLR
ncbi:uncharacterized protein PITG_01323 [Phytophthora infestans T30-4]|uniref:Uncharacterized protein n=1 Tax=Phytophthora infestans (strain T30-4) TaxID=403677 RepID=D0MV81_PHYIT|nr:uncharacterized protein PITG_01323 [Phytophthora infestans T30-4]EEY61077.1 conserved hypothetical protein [Phytophthora infestans T30-4]|eukprot:XP_002907994.1 conserved hypothetical protein [Phytophthora infestans T30-4]